MWWRTRAQLDKSVPATTLVGDFTDDTEPTAAQAQQIIDLASSSVIGITGPLDAAEIAYPPELDAAVTATIAYQAAADIEASFPNTNADKLAWLQARADAALVALRSVVAEFLDTGGTGIESETGEFIRDPWAIPAFGYAGYGPGRGYMLGWPVAWPNGESFNPVGHTIPPLGSSWGVF
jgi:hypothetical protein